MTLDENIREIVKDEVQKAISCIEKEPPKKNSVSPFCIATDDALPLWGILRVQDVLKYVPISKSQWSEWVAEGFAPKGVNAIGRMRCWTVEQIKNFCEQKLSGDSKNQKISRGRK